MAKKKRKTTIHNMKLRKKRSKPVWGGPAEGITQTLISRYLVCPERFRLLTILGLRPQSCFSARLHYGQMWHRCEEALAANKDWEVSLKEYAKSLTHLYRTQGPEIEKWWNVCKVQFPLYVDYWSRHQDVKNRKPIGQEIPFSVAYHLPSGRIATLLGIFDAVDIIGKPKTARTFLQENKSKADISTLKLENQLRFDLQSQFYLVAARVLKAAGLLGPVYKAPIGGVRYNVIRRPLSGGRGSIRPHKATKKKPAETLPDFYRRLADVIDENDSYFFERLLVEITSEDIDKFLYQCLEPLLENIYDDYEWWCWCQAEGGDHYDHVTRSNVFPEHQRRHYRFPYGVYNPIIEGRNTDYDEYLDHGSSVGLETATELYREFADHGGINALDAAV